MNKTTGNMGFIMSIDHNDLSARTEAFYALFNGGDLVTANRWPFASSALALAQEWMCVLAAARSQAEYDTLKVRVTELTEIVTICMS